MKDILINVVSFLLIAILLLFWSYREWYSGKRIIAVIEVLLACIMLWIGIHNYK